MHLVLPEHLEVHLGERDPVEIHAGVLPRAEDDVLGAEERDGHQPSRDRDLEREEVPAASPARHDPSCAVGGERASERRARGVQRRDQPEDEQREHRADDRDAGDGSVELRLEANNEARRHLEGGRQQADHDDLCDKERGETARDGHEAGLEELRADEPPARGAEREADGVLVAARAAARQHQVRDVRARDQKHETHGDHDRDHHRADHGVHRLVQPHVGGRHQEPVALSRRSVVGAQADRMLQVELPSNRLKFRERLLDGHARVQPSLDEEPAPLAVVHGLIGLGPSGGQRHPRGGRHHVGDVHASEVRRHHADDLEPVAAEVHGLPDRRGIGAKAATPELVAEDHHARCAGPIVGRLERATERGVAPDDGEVLAAHHLAGDDVGRAVGDQRVAEARPRRQRGEAGLGGLVVRDVGRRQRDHPEASPTPRIHVVQVGHAVDVRDGGGLEYDRVDRRIHRGRRADPEGQREDGEDGERRRGEEPAPGVADVGPEPVERTGARRACRWQCGRLTLDGL
jgi:hypothetical protein